MSELLTTKKIKRDLSAKARPFLIIAAMFIIATVVFAIAAIKRQVNNRIECVFWFCSLLMFCAFLSCLFGALYYLSNRKKTIVVTDKLATFDVIDGKKVQYVLDFCENGQCTVKEKKKTTDDSVGMYDDVAVDEEFYLVIAKGKKPEIILAYRKSRFELEEA